MREHVWPLLKPRLPMLAGVGVAVLLATAATIAAPLLIGYAIDEGLDKRDENVLERVLVPLLEAVVDRIPDQQRRGDRGGGREQDGDADTRQHRQARFEERPDVLSHATASSSSARSAR